MFPTNSKDSQLASKVPNKLQRFLTISKGSQQTPKVQQAPKVPRQLQGTPNVSNDF
jgi:hypothetical protein